MSTSRSMPTPSDREVMKAGVPLRAASQSTAELAAVATTPSSNSADAFRRAAALHDAGKFAEAETILRDAISRDRSNADLLNARGVMFAKMERHRDALWCYRDALAINPSGSGIWTN